ncbi:MAG: DUF429 domain-containing protein [Myxococcales bacterium]|nr:DUF429 domain-containing protein [Myxococcales bacterium]MDD9967556.1 DUF429 domain-containing protein [Myxococcales bacterium]
MVWTLVGIDCAAQEEHLGLALGELDGNGALKVSRVTLGTAGESAEATIASWLSQADRPLIAINAPLGWPVDLGSALAGHTAGQPLTKPKRKRRVAPEDEAEQLLRRETERVVQTHTGRSPTETTAERMTRRALSALALLTRLRAASPVPLPLAWEPGRDSGVVEVCAEATLRAHRIRAGSYRGRTHKARHARSAIVEQLSSNMSIDVTPDLLTQNSDLLDALICTLAAADFARGLCVAPSDPQRAHREGWIWFRGDGQGSLF